MYLEDDITEIELAAFHKDKRAAELVAYKADIAYKRALHDYVVWRLSRQGVYRRYMPYGCTIDSKDGLTEVILEGVVVFPRSEDAVLRIRHYTKKRQTMQVRGDCRYMGTWPHEMPIITQ